MFYTKVPPASCIAVANYRFVLDTSNSFSRSIPEQAASDSRHVASPDESRYSAIQAIEEFLLITSSCSSTAFLYPVSLDSVAS
jgi:hypothetical protein